MSKNTNLSFLTDYITADITNGRIGINTPSPTVAFDVTGVAKFSSSVTAADLIISDTYANDPLIKLATTTSGSVEVQMRTATTTYNAGIGVVTSGYDFGLFTNNTTRMTIASTGQVGIGKTPRTGFGINLDVSGGIQLTNDSANISYLAFGQNSNPQLSYTYIGGDARSTGFMNFFTNDTERMRITSGGFTKMSNDGTYFGSTGNYHEVRSNVNDWALIMSNTGSTSPQGLFVQYVNASPNNTSSQFLFCRDSGFTVRAEIRSNGGLANYSANNVNLSDIRTKKDIVPLGSYWDKFKAIEIVKFKYKDQTHDDYNIGVISQQVESVAPEFVDIDGFGTTPEDGIPLKSIYTADLYHATIKVLQEAMVKIENQQSQIEELKTLLKA